MKGPEGGSVHDPNAQLPKPMWQRKTTPTKYECQRCKEHRRPRTKRQIKVDAGPAPGFYLICPRCDGTSGSVPQELRQG